MEYIKKLYFIKKKKLQIRVTGLNCTCPNEIVLDGQWYLESITLDGLKQFNLDYSEIYVTEILATESDLMGGNNFMIKGKIIGKERVSKGEEWNPKVKITA